MTSSPPQDPLDIRGQSLTPQSPKPLLLPSPSNVPLLQQEMGSPADASMNLDPPMPADNMSLEVAHNSEEDVAASTQPTESGNEHNDHTEGLEGVSSHLVDAQPELLTTEQAPSKDVVEASSLPSTSVSNASESLEAAVDIVPEPSATQTSVQSSKPSHVEQDFISLNDDTTASSETLVPSNVNIQALLDQLAPSLKTIATPVQDSTTSESQDPLPAPSASLPPRPPPQESNLANANAGVLEDIRSYHPGAQLANVPTTVHIAPSATTTHPLPSPAFLNSPMTNGIDDDDAPFTAEQDRQYDEFIREERINVAEGNWDKFPDGSRLFIGNLPTEKVSKRDVFRRFGKYGRLAQISLKQAYGFVQFLEPSSCARAKDVEQDKPLKGRKMHLEISRPQKKANARDRDGRRRSRSPERNNGRNDRYSSGPSIRDREVRRRDDYRPGRSPSPPRGHRSMRSIDHYGSRRRSRSRSRTPPSRYDRDHRRGASIDDLPLPMRAPHDVPEVQIIAVDSLDRAFLTYAENNFRDRGVKCDVLILSPRLSEAAVVRRQILEGVLGVVILNRKHEATGRFPLQLFDRSSGADRVKFEQYADLDGHQAVALVMRARETHREPVRNTYQAPAYGIPPNYGLPQATYTPAPAPVPASISAPTATPDMSAILAQLGSRPDLAGILAQLTQSQASAGAANPAASMNTDVARYLAGTVSQQPQQPQPYGQMQQQSIQQPHDIGNRLGAYGTLPSAGQPSISNGSGTAQPDMQRIMAQLANYGGTSR